MEVVGNYLSQPDRGFPLDCETLAGLERNVALVAMLGNMGGDRLVLSGCELSKGGGSRGEGWVFLRTEDYPEGEVLRWEGGDVSGGMFVAKESVGVSCQGRDYERAYTRRSLRAGWGAEHYDWEGFVEVKGWRWVVEELGRLEGEVAAAKAQKVVDEPAGVVKMWAGRVVPDGYALCDGRSLRVADYPGLGAVLGSGGEMFRLPDLRGRFVVGQDEDDDDYREPGLTGGEREHVLSLEEMPEHKHVQFVHGSGSGDWKSGGSNSWPDATTNFDAWVSRDTRAAGGGLAHENRPPFYVLAFIMRLM